MQRFVSVSTENNLKMSLTGATACFIFKSHKRGTPMTAPNLNAHPIYLIMREYRTAGQEGISWPQWSKADVIGIVAEDDLGNIVAVYELFEGKCTDILADILAAIPDDDGVTDWTAHDRAARVKSDNLSRKYGETE
jgi:hypothetical protein